MRLRNHIVYSIAVLAALVLFPLCASHAGSVPKPPAPRDVPAAACNCTECGMNVKPDNLFVSQVIFKDGKTAWFCDLGDMMLHFDRLADRASVSAVYVRDYDSHVWTDGRKAYYLTGTSVKTPMRYDILAFADKKRAEAFRAKSGGKKLVSFDEAIARGVFKE